MKKVIKKIKPYFYYLFRSLFFPPVATEAAPRPSASTRGSLPIFQRQKQGSKTEIKIGRRHLVVANSGGLALELAGECQIFEESVKIKSCLTCRRLGSSFNLGFKN